MSGSMALSPRLRSANWPTVSAIRIWPIRRVKIPSSRANAPPPRIEVPAQNLGQEDSENGNPEVGNIRILFEVRAFDVGA